MSRHRLRPPWLPAIAAAIGALFAANDACAQIRARVLRAGLTGGSTHAVRPGDWTTVEVQLSNAGQERFDGALQLEQLDRDGDLCAVDTPVVLAPGQTRAYMLYCLPSLLAEHESLAVRLIDALGRQVRMQDDAGAEQRVISSNPVTLIRPGDTVVLELAAGPAAPRFVRGEYLAPAEDQRVEGRDVRVLPVEPAALPARWHGLQFADVIVMDDPDCTALEPAQLEAVAEWVRYGGRLVLAVGRNWQSVRDGPLAELLPVALSGTREADRMTEWSRVIAPRSAVTSQPSLHADVSPRIARCIAPRRAAIGAECFALPASAGGDDPLILRRAVGRGTVTFVGCALRDLLGLRSRPPRPASQRSTPGDEDGAAPDDLSAPPALVFEGLAAEDVRNQMRDLLGLLLTQPSAPHPGGIGFLDPYDLYSLMTREIAFNQKAGLYVLFTLFFAAGYWAIASLGSFAWLKRRGQLHHAWSAFAAVAAVCAVLGYAAVLALRGVSSRVNDVQVIDGWANRPAATVAGLFGLRTPTYVTEELRLPLGGSDESAAGGGPLAVLPMLSGLTGEHRTFVAPTTYRQSADGRRLSDVTIRATLKQFVGQWRGDLRGQLAARLVTRAVNRGGALDELVEPSVIGNNLGANLRGCVLLHAAGDYVRDGRDVRCFDVGDLPDGGEFRNFARWYRKPGAAAAVSVLDEGDGLLRVADLTDLREAVGAWSNDLLSLINPAAGRPDRLASSLRDVERAMLLLSVFGVYDPRDHSNNTNTMDRYGGRRMDCLHQLSRNMAMLLAFSDQPGPAVLEVGGRPLESARSLTMYRFLIPVERR